MKRTHMRVRTHRYQEMYLKLIIDNRLIVINAQFDCVCVCPCVCASVCMSVSICVYVLV